MISESMRCPKRGPGSGRNPIAGPGVYPDHRARAAHAARQQRQTIPLSSLKSLPRQAPFRRSHRRRRRVEVLCHQPRDRTDSCWSASAPISSSPSRTSGPKPARRKAGTGPASSSASATPSCQSNSKQTTSARSARWGPRMDDQRLLEGLRMAGRIPATAQHEHRWRHQCRAPRAVPN